MTARRDRRGTPLRWFGLCVGLVLAAAPAAVAQDQGFSVGASYDLLYHVPGDSGNNSSAGGHVDVAKGLGRWSVVGELGFNHFETADVQSYLGGVRYPVMAAPNGSFAPYLQVLLGLWRCCEGEFSELALQPGFGIDVRIRDGISIRGALDYRRVFFEEEGENHLRVSAGLVFTFD